MLQPGDFGFEIDSALLDFLTFVILSEFGEPIVPIVKQEEVEELALGDFLVVFWVHFEQDALKSIVVVALILNVQLHHFYEESFRLLFIQVENVLASRDSVKHVH